MSHYFSLEKEKTMSHDVSNIHTTRFVWSVLFGLVSKEIQKNKKGTKTS
jgi:hypothetical protein